MNHPSASPSPGWYPNLEGGPALRWFNGTDWTYQYQAPPQQFAPPPPAKRRFTIHYGFVVVAVISLLATVVPSIFMFAAAGNTASPATDSDAAGRGRYRPGMAILGCWGRYVDVDLDRVRHSPHIKARRT